MQAVIEEVERYAAAELRMYELAGAANTNNTQVPVYYFHWLDTEEHVECRSFCHALHGQLSALKDSSPQLCSRLPSLLLYSTAVPSRSS